MNHMCCSTLRSVGTIFGRILLFLTLTLALIPTFAPAYTTPNTGVNWTMTDLVTHSSGAVTGSGTNFQMHADVFIYNNDTLTIPAGTCIVRDDGGTWPALVILGKLIARGTQSQPILITSGDARGVSGDADYALAFNPGASTQSAVEGVILEKADLGLGVWQAGLTISNCVLRNCGEGLFASTSVTMIDCTISNNNGHESGAGAFVGGGAPIFRRCTIRGNEAGTTAGYYFGGGLLLQNVTGGTIENCTIIENKAQFGGGVGLYQCSNVSIRQNILSSNRVPDYDLDWNGVDLQIENSTNVNVERNSDLGYVFYYESSGSVINNVFQSRSHVGATRCSPLIAHNIFTLTYTWGAVECWDGACPQIFNNVFLGALGILENATTADPIVRNNVFGSAVTSLYWNENASWLVNITDVNALSGNSGNIQAEPRVDLARCSLLFDSPCIDAGYSAGITNDFCGTTRPLDGNRDGVSASDIGPFEYVPFSITTPDLPVGTELVLYTAKLQATNGIPPYTWGTESNAPVGLTLYTNGVFSGIPSLAGTNMMVFIVQDSAGKKATQNLSIVIAPNPNTPPVIDSTLPPQGAFTMNEGASQVFTISAHDPEGSNLTYRWIWDSGTVGISAPSFTRTPDWRDIGQHQLRCILSDGLWTNRVYAQWNVTVVDMPLVIAADSLPSGMELIAYSTQLQASCGTLPYVWATTSSVPAGLSLTASGLLAGTPILAGTNMMVFIVQDSAGKKATQNLSIVIAPNPNTPPVIDSSFPPRGALAMHEGDGEDFTIFAHDPEGSNLTYRWTWDSALVGSNAMMYSRTPGWLEAGTHQLRCTLSDGLWTNRVYALWNVTVSDVPFMITTDVVPQGMELTSYRMQLQASNGQAPFAWSVTSQMPDGLSLSSIGLVSGVPMLAGTYAVAASVRDALGQQATKMLYITITSNPDNTPPVVDSTSPPQGTITLTENMSQLFVVSAHDPEGSNLWYRWTWDGITVGNSSSSNTVTPGYGEAGSHQLRCYVSDGAWISRTFAQWNVTVTDVEIEITTTSLPFGSKMVAYETHLAATNGIPPYSWSIAPQVVAWGDNEYGKCAIPENLGSVLSVAAGAAHSMALKSEGTVVAWGCNDRGQCTVPSGLSNVVAIAAGVFHSLALTSNGTVVAWGYNDCGPCDIPTGLSNVVAIASGLYHSLARKDDGTVVAWGDYSDFGTVPEGLSNVIAIAAGVFHNLALKSNGTVVAWGSYYEDYGQFDVPADLSNVVAIAAGYYHSLAVKADGTVVAWGSQRDVPADLRHVMAIAAGCDHSLALTSDGALFAWGDNWAGQCNVPSELNNIHFLACGGSHNLVLRQDLTQLPEGVTLSPDGHMSGAPIKDGMYWVSFVAKDVLGQQATRELALMIAPDITAPVIDSCTPDQGTLTINEGTCQMFSVMAHAAEGDNIAYRWNWDGALIGSDSSCFTLATGWGDAGTHYLRCMLSDRAWTNRVYAQWPVRVMDVPFIVTTTHIPSGTEMVGYNVQFGATNGIAPFIWSAASPLPEGLSLSASGQLSGLPLVAGMTQVTITAQDAIGQCASQNVSLVIAPSANASPIVDSTAPPQGVYVMTQGMSQVFSFSTHDPEGSNLTYRWMWDGKPVGSNLTSYARTTSWRDIGQHQLCCFVSDGFWTNYPCVQWSVIVQNGVVGAHGLVGYWPLNGSAFDRSAWTNNGTVYGAVTWTNGPIGQAGFFDQRGVKYINIKHQSQYVFTNAFTVLFWFKGVLPGRVIQKHWPTAHNYGNCWEILAGSPGSMAFLYAWQGSPDYYGGLGFDCPVTNWNHYAFTYDLSSNRLKAYLNGCCVTNATPSHALLPMSSTLDILLMHDRYSGSGYYDATGWLDDVSLWSRALSETEIGELYHCGSSFGQSGYTLGVTQPLALFVAGSPSTLGVSSPYLYGSNGIWDVAGTRFYNSVEPSVPINDRSRYTCAGWFGDGTEPEAGSGNTASFFTANAATQTWLWAMQHRLDTSTNGCGYVLFATNWVSAGSATTLTAAANPHWHFDGWEGDTNGAVIVETNLTLTVNGPVQVTARFALNRYGILSSAASSGSIQPTGVVFVAYGSSTNFFVQADAHYHVDVIMTNGAPVAGTGGVTATNVWFSVFDTGSIYAAFAPTLATNGTPEWWLAENGLTGATWNAEALDDRDHDGMANWQEWVAGTDPTNAASRFRVVGVDPGPPVTVLFEPTSTARVYTLLWTSDLATGGWFNASSQTQFPGQDGVGHVTDAESPARARFYRVNVELP